MVLTATAATTAAIGLAFAVVFGGGIIKQADARDGACEVGSNMSSCASRGVGSCEMDSNGTCEIEAKGRTAKIDITCDALKGNQIDWDCVFGPESLEEVFDRGGKMTTCKEGTKSEPCSRFIVPKEEERAEVKVQAGPEGFPFLKHEKYIFRYSFQAKEGMRVAKRFTHLGQLKGSKNRRMLKGDPIYSLTANHHGLNVRFSNKESIEDFHDGMEKHLDWDKATGEWVHVKVTTVFGESMEVELSGAVSGKAVWPKHLEPVAWHRDSKMVRMKLGLYHSKGNVHDQEVIYKNVSIEGPNGIIRSGDKANSEPSDKDCAKKDDKKKDDKKKDDKKKDDKNKKDNEIAEVKGYTYKGCFRDTKEDRVFPSESKSDSMTTEKCADYCKGSKVFATQHARECWCGDSKTDFDRHGKADCNLACSGSKNGEICGGKWAMSVYQAEGKSKSDDKDSAPDGIKYLGCFKDDKVHRALNLVDKNVSDSMTLEKCHKFCSKKSGATHMGLEFSTECFCGGSKDDHDVYGGVKCDMPCAGDSGSVCGGRLALSVYKI